MEKTCRQCQSTFEIDSGELDFLERVSPIFDGKKESVPLPTLCPDCRVQRRFVQRNERWLYRRPCNLTGSDIISFYASDSPYKVYEKDAWWSDRWDAQSYGRPYSPSQSFFEQFQELRLQVPRLGMVMTQAEGGHYSPYCVNTKNCYMSVSCLESEDCYFCYQTNRSKDCVDCSNVRFCERAYDCLHCFQLTSCVSCRDCENGSGLAFCTDCRGCHDCIGCKNLVNKHYWLFNRQATPEEYAETVRLLRGDSGRRSLGKNAADLALRLPTRAMHLVQCEDCTGDHLRNCCRCTDCFDVGDSEDCSLIYTMPSGARDCRDLHYAPGAELVYDSLSAVRSFRTLFALHSWDVGDALYTDECFSSMHLFGCCGLRHKEYCILNQQYTKEEYEALVPQIIAAMRRDGEWGEFFPSGSSPFAYNESIAQEFRPLTKEEVLNGGWPASRSAAVGEGIAPLRPSFAKATDGKQGYGGQPSLREGWKWRERIDEKPKALKTIPAAQLPDSIDAVPDDILHWAIECEATGKPFKIIQQELSFYRTMGVPIPRIHPDERYRRRMARRNPPKLWVRSCAKCGKDIRTTYAPDRPEIVYCEECYLKEVY